MIHVSATIETDDREAAAQAERELVQLAAARGWKIVVGRVGECAAVVGRPEPAPLASTAGSVAVEDRS